MSARAGTRGVHKDKLHSTKQHNSTFALKALLDKHVFFFHGHIFFEGITFYINEVI